MKKTDVIFERRSIRSYTGEPVSQEDLRLILKAGMAAPSARNSRPWEFIVIQNRDMLKEMSAVRPYWKMLDKAGAAIVVLANLKGYQSSHRDFFIQDCAAATENMLLAAAGLGLGAVWLGLHPIQEAEEAMRQMLAIPEEVVPFAVVSIGHPGEQKAPHEAYEAERVHWERFGKEAAR